MCETNGRVAEYALRITSMLHCIGADEAGYGPNLGPLVVSVSRWQIAEQESASERLFERLKPFVTEEPVEANSIEQLAIADSKALYKPGGSLASIERGVLAALGTLGQRPRRWRAIWSAVAGAGTALELSALPWYADFDLPLPLDCGSETVDGLAMAFTDTQQAAGVVLTGLESAVLPPSLFNALTARHDSKGEVLSRTTLTLVERAVAACETGSVLVVCDKHGGRNKYAPLLQQYFPEHLVEIRLESAAESRYQWGPRERRVEFVFRAKGERFLPAALSSMACKYLRELAMLAENAFWQRRLPGLKGTAGYPEDAKRFKAEIVSLQAELGIDDNLLWRNR